MGEVGRLLRELVEARGLCEPVLLKGLHVAWPPLQWTLEEWDKALTRNERNLLPCRLGRKNAVGPSPEWEWMSREAELSWSGLRDWTSEDWWAVYDYKHLPHVLLPPLVNGFDWSEVGYAERSGTESNLWIGTQSSFTPCHFDTYGANFVAQVRGHKEWILFPPEDRVHLSPARVPYEESSVYSNINFQSPTFAQLKQLSKCHGRSVILEPGDVLFVPPKWWHSVSSLDFSISLNTWIEIAEDRRSRVEEAILSSLVASIFSISDPETRLGLLNPNQEALEEMMEPEVVHLLRTTSQDFHAQPQPPQHSSPSNCLERLMAAYPTARIISPHVFPPPSHAKPRHHQDGPSQQQPNYVHHLVNTLGHPDVLSLITQTFLSILEKEQRPDTKLAFPERTGDSDASGEVDVKGINDH